MNFENRSEAPVLSSREIQTLHRIVDGMSNAAIARSLEISENTVKCHVKSVLKKLRASNRTHAAIMAVQTGVIACPSPRESRQI